MKIRQTFSLGMMCAVLAVGAAIYAQDSSSNGERQSATTQESQESEKQLKEKYLVELDVHGDRVFAFVDHLENRIGEKIVKGAPFSAQVIVENSQTLTNGVHINSKSTGMLYRDSDGRFRSEEPRDGGPEMVFINDPVARVDYHLHMFQRTAVKVSHDSIEADRETEERKAEMHQKHVEMERKLMAEEHALQLHCDHGNQGESVIPDGQLKEDRRLGRERRVESLGPQNFEGVQAVGTRVTFTFAAGREGNDRPFDVVTEKWYSPELQIVVMTRHSDPRSGESIYRLTNINRSEPARSLFEAPADFRLKEEVVELRRK